MTKELISMLCQQGKDGLERTFAAVPDDKVSWKPAEGANSALDLFSEAAQTFAMVAGLVESKGEAKPNREMFAQFRAERANWTRQDALTHIETNYSRFKAALEPLTDEQLATPITMPMGGGITAPMALWIMMAYRSSISRFAQINYIQTLYGDLESH